jgi:hypothetical protein
MGFVRFMASKAGRGLRIVAGAALIGIGAAIGGTAGIVVAVVGLLPLAMGLLDFCILAPLFRAPLRGCELRAPR